LRNDLGAFHNQNDFAYWWTASANGADAWLRYLYSTGTELNGLSLDPNFGISIRCLQNPPAAPTIDTQAESSLTATTATLNATFTDGGSSVTATGFKYGTDALLTSPLDVTGSGTTSPFTAALTGLTASTQYWAVGYATNAVGTSYGDTITFTTSAAAAFTCGTSTVSYDGHNYTTVQIGSQCWFKEDLRNDNYNDGSAITGNLDDASWVGTSSGAQAVYGEGSSAVTSGNGDEVANLATYGRIYNWYAVSTGLLCPSGWHVPTVAEWDTLASTLGGFSVAGTKLKVSPSNTPAWDGDNASGFSALPAGWRDLTGYFDGQNYDGSWWSSYSPDNSNGWYFYLVSTDAAAYRYSGSTRYGFSVRCLQD
jgi:uncharacterized protein (TIGR02145 family)